MFVILATTNSAHTNTHHNEIITLIIYLFIYLLNMCRSQLIAGYQLYYIGIISIDNVHFHISLLKTKFFFSFRSIKTIVCIFPVYFNFTSIGSRIITEEITAKLNVRKRRQVVKIYKYAFVLLKSNFDWRKKCDFFVLSKPFI